MMGEIGTRNIGCRALLSFLACGIRVRDTRCVFSAGFEEEADIFPPWPIRYPVSSQEVWRGHFSKIRRGFSVFSPDSIPTIAHPETIIFDYVQLTQQTGVKRRV